jgi:hypothetical protein
LYIFTTFFSQWFCLILNLHNLTLIFFILESFGLKDDTMYIFGGRVIKESSIEKTLSNDMVIVPNIRMNYHLSKNFTHSLCWCCYNLRIFCSWSEFSIY